MTPDITTTILPNGNLRLTASRELIDSLHESQESDPDYFDTTQHLWEVLEDLNNETDYEYCEPAWAGALTDAPMIAVFECEEKPLPKGLRVQAHAYYNTASEFHQKDGTISETYRPVAQCWAFMDYALRNPLEDMLSQGYSDWQAGHDSQETKTS